MSGDTPYQLAGMMGTGAGGMASSAFNPAAYNSAAYNGDGGSAYAGETGRAASGDGATLGPAVWAPNPAGQNGLWSQALGTTGRMQSNGNGAGSSYSGGGFMVGVDHAVSDHWLIGAAGGYSRAHWDASLNGTSPASGTVQTPQGALYARYTAGPWLLSMSGGYADHKFDASRSVVIGPSTTNAVSSHHGGEWSTDAQVEYSLASGAWQVRPLMGVRYSHLREDAFNESGAGLANLSMNARTTDSTTISAGARVLRAFTDNTGDYEFKAVYSHLFGQRLASLREIGGPKRSLHRRRHAPAARRPHLLRRHRRDPGTQRQRLRRSEGGGARAWAGSVFRGRGVASGVVNVGA